MSELAETLRAWVEAENARLAASDECGKARDRARHVFDGTVVAAKDYLRGYDDARAEMDPHIEKLERENEAMKSQLAAPKPAAVGVVGAVRWGLTYTDGDLTGLVWDNRKDAQEYSHNYTGGRARVVAIVDSDAIVPLASKEPLKRCVDTHGLLYWKADYSVRADAKLYVAAHPAAGRA
jgi:hypothetical protein